MLPLKWDSHEQVLGIAIAINVNRRETENIMLSSTTFFLVSIQVPKVRIFGNQHKNIWLCTANLRIYSSSKKEMSEIYGKAISFSSH